MIVSASKHLGLGFGICVLFLLTLALATPCVSASSPPDARTENPGEIEVEPEGRPPGGPPEPCPGAERADPAGTPCPRDPHPGDRPHRGSR